MPALPTATPSTVEIAALAFGFAGQALFSARLLVQWVASERARRSVVPVAFWWLSLAGGITLLLYATYRRDPVFILGQATGLVVYWRNLRLIRRASQGLAAEHSAEPGR